MELKESKNRNMGGFEDRKGKREMVCLYYSIINKRNIQKIKILLCSEEPFLKSVLGVINQNLMFLIL